jgi:hypothetical protein
VRVEVALHGDVAADAGDGVVEIDAVVDAEGVHTDRRHVGEDLTGADAEMDERYVEALAAHGANGLQRSRGCRSTARR